MEPIETQQNPQPENTETTAGGISINTILLAVIALLFAIQVVTGFGSSGNATAENDLTLLTTDNTMPTKTLPDKNQMNLSPTVTVDDLGKNKTPEPPKPTGPTTNISFAKNSYDFGKIKQDSKHSHTFKFTNNGVNPLTITDAKGACGCTVPSFPKEPIPPGGTGEIVVEYSPGKQKGAQTKTVTVTANTNPPTTTLTVTAEVEEVGG
jgi:hypothetical protein